MSSNTEQTNDKPNYRKVREWCDLYRKEKSIPNGQFVTEAEVLYFIAEQLSFSSEAEVKSAEMIFGYYIDQMEKDDNGVMKVIFTEDNYKNALNELATQQQYSRSKGADKVKVYFKNNEGRSLLIEVGVKDLIEKSSDWLYEKLEDTVPCSCNINESNPFCECASRFEDYEIDLSKSVPSPSNSTEPTDAQIESFVLKVMEQDPKKAASWITVVAGRECIKSNVAEMVIKLDADMPDGKRYNIVNTIKISDPNEANSTDAGRDTPSGSEGKEEEVVNKHWFDGMIPKKKVLSMLQENMEIGLTDEDAVRDQRELVKETYQDLIEIIKTM